ncbi:MAG: SelT/SelW/SelH family protein [Candidatus Schekmanbacteria bacterium]|nr:SelT/SelW/SelH family protein [Candidatus Schekmanbacteria bacterium]
MTEKILKKLKRKISSLTLVPDAGGKFELSVDGELIYSKLGTGKFPEESAILAQLEKRV